MKTILILSTIALSIVSSGASSTIDHTPNGKTIAVEHEVEYPIEIVNRLLKDKAEAHQKELQYQKDKTIYEEKVKKRNAIIEENLRKNNIYFDQNNVLAPSNLTLEELSSIFESLGKHEMIKLTEAIIDAEKEYGVNALFYSGLIALESGWGTKPAGSGDNYTGHGVFNSTYVGTSFNGSFYANIMETAEMIKRDYLTEGGSSFYGHSVYNVNTDYCLTEDSSRTDYEWSDKIIWISNHLLNIYNNDIKLLEDIPEKPTFAYKK